MDFKQIEEETAKFAKDLEEAVGKQKGQKPTTGAGKGKKIPIKIPPSKVGGNLAAKKAFAEAVAKCALGEEEVEGAEEEPVKQKIKVGDHVQVVVENPAYGWGAVDKKDVGKVTYVDDDGGGCTIDFPEHTGWHGFTGDLAVTDKEVGHYEPEKEPNILMPVPDEEAGFPQTMHKTFVQGMLVEPHHKAGVLFHFDNHNGGVLNGIGASLDGYVQVQMITPNGTKMLEWCVSGDKTNSLQSPFLIPEAGGEILVSNHEDHPTQVELIFYINTDGEVIFGPVVQIPIEGEDDDPIEDVELKYLSELQDVVNVFNQSQDILDDEPDTITLQWSDEKGEYEALIGKPETVATQPETLKPGGEYLSPQMVDALISPYQQQVNYLQHLVDMMVTSGMKAIPELQNMLQGQTYGMTIHAEEPNNPHVNLSSVKYFTIGKSPKHYKAPKGVLMAFHQSWSGDAEAKLIAFAKKFPEQAKEVMCYYEDGIAAALVQ